MSVTIHFWVWTVAHVCIVREGRGERGERGERVREAREEVREVREVREGRETNLMFTTLDDTVCTVLPDNGTCNSDAPSVYSQDPFGDASKDYCSGNLPSSFVSFSISITSLSLPHSFLHLIQYSCIRIMWKDS